MPDQRTRGEREASLRRTLGLWLEQFRWTHWGTYTFRVGCPRECPRRHPGKCRRGWGPDGPSPQGAFRHIGQFLTSDRGLPGYFYCVERGSFGRVHGHALMRFDQYEIRGSHTDAGNDTFNAWKDRFGRCQVRAYDPELGAVHYCSKYIVKDPLLWDVGRLTSRA